MMMMKRLCVFFSVIMMIIILWVLGLAVAEKDLSLQNCDSNSMKKTELSEKPEQLTIKTTACRRVSPALIFFSDRLPTA